MVDLGYEHFATSDEITDLATIFNGEKPLGKRLMGNLIMQVSEWQHLTSLIILTILKSRRTRYYVCSSVATGKTNIYEACLQIIGVLMSSRV